jgi:predicted O-methyltransferase YrrM
MNKAEEFHLKVLSQLKDYQIDKVDKYFINLFRGDKRDQSYWREIYRQYDYPCYYYQYLACAVRVLQAKQVVEIGADRGVSAIMMASEGANVTSIDIRDGWEYVKGKDIAKNSAMNVGDSLAFDGSDELKNTNLWLIDGLHTYEQVKQELDHYQKYFQGGTVVLLDDVQEYNQV